MLKKFEGLERFYRFLEQIRQTKDICYPVAAANGRAGYYRGKANIAQAKKIYYLTPDVWKRSIE